MHVPFADLSWQHRQIKDEVRQGWEAVVSSTSFIQGQAVSEFEQALAAYTGVCHCVGVGSGTDALELVIRALGIGLNDEVIVPANSFVASALAVVRAGADVVLVDSETEYHMIDVDQLTSRSTARTKAVMPVHLYGQLAPLQHVASAASELGVQIVEDAAQSHGATQGGHHLGQASAAAATSFYPGKNLGAYGDGGAVLTNSDDLAEAVRRLGNWGSKVKYDHETVGFNSRLDSMQAIVLLAKLRRLDEWNELRRQAAGRYDAWLADLEDVVSPTVAPGNVHAWHLYVVQVHGRNRVVQHLDRRSVEAGVHYPKPIHLQQAFSFLGHRTGDFPVAEQTSERVLSLPIYPGITPEQQEHVVSALREAIEE